MKLTRKELILFDLDGTLIDSVPDLSFAVNHMLKRVGYDTFSEDIIRTWVGNGASMLVQRALLGDIDTTQKLEEAFFEGALDIFLTFYGKNLSGATAYPNVIDTLLELKDMGYRMAIVTNKPFKFVQPILDGLGIGDIFDYILGGDSLEKRKPDPMPLLYICEKLDISIEKTIMIGDSKNDIVSANLAGIQSIGVTYGYNYGENISTYNPDFVCDDFADILTLLKRS